MNRRLVLTLSGIVSLVIIAIWYVRLPDQGTQSATKTTRKAGSGVVVPSDTRWDKMAEPELRQFTSQFEQTEDKNAFSCQTTVAIGQSIVTQAYEGKPGEFVLTQLTPALRKPVQDDHAELEFDLVTRTVDPGGNERQLSTHSLKMHKLPGGKLQGSLYIGAKEGTYQIEVNSSNDFNKNNIKLEMKGGYTSRTKKSSSSLPD